MGEKRVSSRTLPTGEKVLHHPDGRMVLQVGNSLADSLSEQAEDQMIASAAMTEALVQSAVDKREAQLSGDPIPSDKSPV